MTSPPVPSPSSADALAPARLERRANAPGTPRPPLSGWAWPRALARRERNDQERSARDQGNPRAPLTGRARSASLRRPRRRALIGLALAAGLGLAGCGGQTHWLKAGCNQADYDRDRLDCEVVAEALARSQSQTGRVDPFALDPPLNQCLMSKGWTPVLARPPAPGENVPEREWAALREDGAVEGFGLRLRLPPGFALLRQGRQQVGPTELQSFFWQGPDDTYVNMLFQENQITPFQRLAYPLPRSFHSYASGRGQNGDDLRWRAYFGVVQGSWVGAVGAYYLTDDRRRLVLVITTALPAPEAPPPPGLRLSLGQKEAMERFLAPWEDWLHRELPDEASFWSYLRPFSPFRGRR